MKNGRMNEREIVEAIRSQHLKANVADYERPGWAVRWDYAHVDGLGGAPYLHVPIDELFEGCDPRYYCSVRVYPTKRLGLSLIERNGYRWGKTWRRKPGVPKNWPKRVTSSERSLRP